MRKTILVIAGLLVFTMPLFGCKTQQQFPPGNSPEVESSLPIEYHNLGNIFAMANAEGDRLITITPIEKSDDMDTLTLAIGDNGQRYPVKLVEKQEGNDRDTGRATASNFENMEGYIYTVLEKKTEPDNTYYITSEELVPEKSILQSTLTHPQALNNEDKAAINQAKGKTVREGWTLASYNDGIQLQTAVFEPEGKKYLMSIIMKTKDGGLKFIDYPAVSDDGYSVWRVDDGGKIDPSLFSVLFAAHTDKGVLFVLSWLGAEGENTFFLLEQGDKLQEQPVKAYRYWSPA